jgi:hypothetical protein
MYNPPVVLSVTDTAKVQINNIVCAFTIFYTSLSVRTSAETETKAISGILIYSSTLKNFCNDIRWQRLN